MQLKKHLYLQKPLTHDIYEARILTQASEKYKVVTQMGDQGASCDGMRTLREWIEADVLGEIEKVYCWTDRPVWPQGIPWPTNTPPVPKELNWDLWLGYSSSKLIISIILFLSTGVAGGNSVPELLATWVVI